MRPDDITPVILTYNEAPNIDRVLAGLSWARDVVVVDSHSADATPDIVRTFPNVRLFRHEFTSHAAQWSYAVRGTGISTEWVLVLDSDFILGKEFVGEFTGLKPPAQVAAYEARFRYCIRGRPLPRSIFPSRIVLCRRESAQFVQDGHTQRLFVAGEVRRLKATIDHDDRKTLTHWVKSQDAYAKLERERLLTADRRALRPVDRIRARLFIAPIAVLLYCLLVKRLIFAGLPGWYYTYQRVMAELLLSLYLIEDRLVKHDPP